ncbi:MAG: 3-hydroxyacyl-ACP dehydratase [Crocinitomicaceae bacterium]|nr:3-hydroxyacyl-ACP dehydratase [Crocinitomicaceae bacterium]
MLLKDKLYSITQLQFDENQLVATLKLNAEDAIYKGHFPGNPITPGVAQLEMIKELLSTHYNRSIQLKSISNCKYLAILNPIGTPEITVKLTIGEHEGDLKVNAVFSFEEKIFTKSQGIYS